MCGIGQGYSTSHILQMQLFLFKASQLFSNQGLSVSHMLKPDVNINCVQICNALFRTVKPYFRGGHCPGN